MPFTGLHNKLLIGELPYRAATTTSLQYSLLPESTLCVASRIQPLATIQNGVGDEHTVRQDQMSSNKLMKYCAVRALPRLVLLGVIDLASGLEGEVHHLRF